jgi:hypothetical protein
MIAAHRCRSRSKATLPGFPLRTFRYLPPTIIESLRVHCAQHVEELTTIIA